MSHTWIHNPDTGGYWQCPNGLAEQLVENGWELCDPPAVPNPATAEQAAWREAQPAETETEAAPTARETADETEPTPAAVGGESEEG